jgi:hypothetical protein
LSPPRAAPCAWASVPGSGISGSLNNPGDVKSTETSREDQLHLHFMDPPLGELRSAIYALQSRNETRAT